MENYGNDLFLSQEGCPSLDFTLLDRPSSSAVSAPGATALLFPGENSFPSFDIFDGAGAESFTDRSFPGHRSFTSQVQRDAVRGNAPGVVQRQMHGVHDFLGQDNQQHVGSTSSWSGIGSGGNHVQSPHLFPGLGNAENMSVGNVPMKDSLWGNTQSGPSVRPTGDGGIASIRSSQTVDYKRSPIEVGSTSVASQVRNQLGATLQHSNDTYNSSSKFNSLPVSNGVLEHQSATRDMVIQNATHQNQFGKYASQTPAGASVNEAPRLDSLVNQLSWKGMAQTAHEPLMPGPSRGGGMTELQLLRQQALQSKHEQALQSKQQQQALRLQQQEALRLQQQEALRVEQQEALRVQQQEAVRLQQHEAARLQQQEAVRMQQQEGLKLQQQEVTRRQQQRLQQQEAMKQQHQETMRLQQHELMRSQQHDSMQSQQYEAMWLRQHDASQSQQQDGTQPQSQDARRQGVAQWQQHEVMQSQQQASWPRKQQVLWSQQGQVLDSEQQQMMQSQPKNAWFSQQQQVLPTQQQQALRLGLQSQQHQAWQTEQQQALHSHQQQLLRSPQQQGLNPLQQQQVQALRMQQQQQQQALWIQQQAVKFQHQQALQLQQQQSQQQQQASPIQQHNPLQTQHHFQELLAGQQLKQQLELSGSRQAPQEACTEFPGTSFSALLHGPDTPPSQPEVGEEPVLSELEDQGAAFPSASTQNSGWLTNGSSYYQGLPNDPSMVPNLVEQQNLLSGSTTAEVSYHPHNFNTSPNVQNARMGNNVPEYDDSGLLSPVVQKPMFQTERGNDFSSDPAIKLQVHANNLAQGAQSGSEHSVVHGLDTGLHQANLLSQSQQHFQALHQLRQRRSWESLSQKQEASKPTSDASQSLSQHRSTPVTITPQSGTQQTLSSIDASSRSFGNDSYQSGRIYAGNADGFKHQQRFTKAVGEASRSMDIDGDDGNQHSKAWTLQTHQLGQNAAYSSHQSSDARHDIWVNKTGQQAMHITQNTVSSSFPPSESSQGGFHRAQSTLPEGGVARMEVAGARSCLSSQGSFKVNEESCWKETDRAALSEQATLPLSESDQFSHGFWKRQGSLQESVGGLYTVSKPAGTGGTWNNSFQQQAKMVSEPQLDRHAASNLKHTNAGQGTLEARFLGREGVSQSLQKQSDRVSNQQFASSPNAFSGGTATPFYINNDDGQIHQGFADKQRISLLQGDPSAANVSLAHLRQSRPSSPLSPQHVKLGLGPSSLPQNIQLAGSAGTRMSPLREGLLRKGPTSSLEGKKYAAPSYGACVHESTLKTKADINQGMGAQLNGTLLQNNGRPSSALSNSSSFSKESVESETLAAASYPSAHLERYLVSQTNVNSLCGAEHSQSGSFEEESLASLHGRFTAGSESSRQPFVSLGDSHGNLSTGNPQPNNDTSSVRVLQNQQIINMALKQLGNRAQAANLAGFLTTLKTSLSDQQSKNLVGRESFLSGIAESDQPQSSGTQKDGLAGGIAMQSMQRPQMISRRPSTSHGDSSPSNYRAGSHSVYMEHTDHLTVNQEKPHTSDGSGSESTRLLADMQRQRGQSISFINGNRPLALHSAGQCDDDFMGGSKTSNFVPLQQADSQMRGSEASFTRPGQTHYLQQQRSVLAVEGSSLQELSKERTPGAAWGATFPNLAVTAATSTSNETLLRSLDSSPLQGYLPGVSLGQQDAGALTAKQNYKSLMDLKVIQEQNASDSEYLNRRGLHFVNGSPAVHVRLPQQVAVGNTVPLTCTAKGADAVVESEMKALHEIRLQSRKIDQVLPSQELRSDACAHDKLLTSPDICMAIQHTQPVATGDQDTRGKDDPDFKVDEIRGQTASLSQSPQHEVSPSKLTSCGVATVHPKKRKKPVPLLIPWHVAATQPRNSVPSTSDAEAAWANAANRLPEKEDGADVHKDNVASGFRAKRRLKLTTQLMQQLIPPLPSRLMHGNSVVDNEITTYSVAKLELEDACRLMANAQREANSAHESSETKNIPLRGQQGRTWGVAKNVAVMRCVESFVEKAKRLDGELARVDRSTSVSELVGRIKDLEKMALVNRLARHHGIGFTVDSSEICLKEKLPDVGIGIRKPSPKKYVTVAPMPRTLPAVKCLSL